MSCANPALFLDKAHKPLEDMKMAKQVLQEAIRCRGDWSAVERQIRRFREALQTVPGAMQEVLETNGPLALHLARAGAFENASLAFHPVYAVPYLPGSGLKGIARSWAENCAGAPRTEIDRIFGPRLGKENEDAAAAAGSVIFFDALPDGDNYQTIVDIVNSHHSNWYQGGSNYEDTEDPVPVFFLAVKKGAKFRFAVAPRRGQAVEDAKMAFEWLKRGLVYLGAGAKTSAGYGRFRGAWPKTEHYAEKEFSLELVSPAFLAGAGQTKEDCELRGATLRGVLRWWWRAEFSQWFNAEQLRQLESALWGSASQQGALQLALEAIQVPEPKLFSIKPSKDRSEVNQSYIAYGMNDAKKGSRFYLDAGAKWTLRIIGNSFDFAGVKHSGQTALAIAERSLSRVCSFGGVGAKARKGYGSVNSNAQGNESLQVFLRDADAKRQSTANGPCFWLNDAPKPFPLKTNNVQQALTTLAKAYKKIPKKFVDYGLPRTGLREKTSVKRCSSPLHFSLKRDQAGRYFVRLTVLPTPSINRAVKVKDPAGKWKGEHPFRAIQEFEAALKEIV